MTLGKARKHQCLRAFCTEKFPVPYEKRTEIKQTPVKAGIEMLTENKLGLRCWLGLVQIWQKAGNEEQDIRHL